MLHTTTAMTSTTKVLVPLAGSSSERRHTGGCKQRAKYKRDVILGKGGFLDCDSVVLCVKNKSKCQKLCGSTLGQDEKRLKNDVKICTNLLRLLEHKQIPLSEPSCSFCCVDSYKLHTQILTFLQTGSLKYSLALHLQVTQTFSLCGLIFHLTKSRSAHAHRLVCVCVCCRLSTASQTDTVSHPVQAACFLHMSHQISFRR